MPVPTLDEVRAWCMLAPSSMDDAQLTHVLAAEQALQGAYCIVPVDPEPYPDELYQALMRRCARHVSARGIPLGLTGDTEYGPVRLPSWDVEIERLEAPYRVIPVA